MEGFDFHWVYNTIDRTIFYVHSRCAAAAEDTELATAMRCVCVCVCGKMASTSAPGFSTCFERGLCFFTCIMIDTFTFTLPFVTFPFSFLFHYNIGCDKQNELPSPT